MFKLPKPAYQILAGLFILSFTVVACNNKKAEEKKEVTNDSLTVTPTQNVTTTTTTTTTTSKVDSTGDSLKKRPTAPGD